MATGRFPDRAPPLLAGLIVSLASGGCSTGDGVYDGLDRADRAVSPGSHESARAQPEGSRVVAYISGRPVTTDDLWATLAEGFGSAAFEEIVLDRELERQARLAGVDLFEQDLRSERARLARTLSRGELDEEAIGVILDRLRDDRGLGPARYDALLRRNAILRRLVADEITVSEPEIRRAFDIVFGERIQCRLIVVATDREATSLRTELAAESNDLATRFAQAARRASLDPSGEFGGAMDPISPVDPAYPAALRSALASADAGKMTPVLALDGAYALALVEQKLDPEPRTLEAEHDRIARVLRERKERSAIGELAARLVREAQVEIIDRSLAWSWDRRAR